MFNSVQFSHSVVYEFLQPHGLQHTRLPSPSPTPGAYSNSCPSSQWCRPTISSSVVPFSSRPQSFPASGSFPVSQVFASGGQRIGASASASVLLMSIQGWFPLALAVKIPNKLVDSSIKQHEISFKEQNTSAVIGPRWVSGSSCYGSFFFDFRGGQSPRVYRSLETWGYLPL